MKISKFTKVLRAGPSSLVVTIPHLFAKKHNLKHGDTVNLVALDDQMIIYPLPPTNAPGGSANGSKMQSHEPPTHHENGG